MEIIKIRDQFLGIGIAEFENNRIKCMNYGYANADTGERVEDKSVFHLCSLSKFVTSILVMILVQEKRLDLDKPVNTYLEDWKLSEENGQEANVTLMHLLTHRGGVCDAEDITMEIILSKCGMRCDLCLIYRPYVLKNDRRREICSVYSKIYPGYEPDPNTIICDGCSTQKEDPVLLDPSCKARKCVIEKKLQHCGYCEQYPCSIFPAEPTQEELVQKIDVEKQWTWEDEKLMEAYTCKKNMDEFKNGGI